MRKSVSWKSNIKNLNDLSVLKMNRFRVHENKYARNVFLQLLTEKWRNVKEILKACITWGSFLSEKDRIISNNNWVAIKKTISLKISRGLSISDHLHRQINNNNSDDCSNKNNSFVTDQAYPSNRPKSSIK